MGIVHVPNDNVAIIENSQPGDEIIFNAGLYVLDCPVRLRNDRYYKIVGQKIEASDSFQGRYLFEIEEGNDNCCICDCHIDLKSKCGFISFLGQNFIGLIYGNFVSDALVGFNFG